MNRSEIEKLMQSASSEQIAWYEMISYNSKKLHDIYNEYIDVSDKRNNKMLSEHLYFPYKIMLSISFVTMSDYISSMSTNFRVFNINILSLISIYSFGYIIFYHYIDIKRYNRIINKCELIFKDFEQEVNRNKS